MNKNLFILYGVIIILLVMIVKPGYAISNGRIQQPTIALPTVTGTPKGITVTVSLNQEDPINVRSGPGQLFEKVGVLLAGQEAPALGRSAGGDWIMIAYPGAPNNIGWVYTFLVELSPGELPIIEPPPTPTLQLTQTVDPTLAAQFISTPFPTRLPTFTPVDPLVIPTYGDLTRVSLLGGIPMGLVIMVLAGLGSLLAIFSYIRTR